MRHATYWGLIALAIHAPPARGQDTVVVVVDQYMDATSGPARRAVSDFNDEGTTRFFGETTIPSDRHIEGDIGVLDGPLLIRGSIRGDVIAINADVILEDIAVVRGDITVFGGEIFGLSEATVIGDTRAYRSSLRVERVGGRIRLREDPDRGRRRNRIRWFDRDRGDFSIVVNANTYNRVEGLPLRVGPRFRLPAGELGSFTLEGLGILRTAGDLDDNRQDLGYEARATLGFGRPGEISIGVRAYDIVTPVESWKLADEEVGLATFLWHRDYRDYFLRRGVAGYLQLEPDPAITLTAEIARNEDESVTERDPWTPFRKDDLWRINPPADEGTFTTVSARLVYDARDGRRWEGSGWYFAAEWERGSSDTLSTVPLPTTIRPAISTIDYTYDRAVIDVRRYERIGWSGQLALRAFGAGVIGNDPLPVQRRLSLGGIEPMPGFPFRRFACNEQVFSPGDAALCDRVFLLQAEYRGNLSFSAPWFEGHGWHRHHPDAQDDHFDEWDDWFWFGGPAFVLFANAGTAWLEENGPGNLEADVGAGLSFGGFGIYAAKAVSEDESLRIMLRLNRRF